MRLFEKIVQGNHLLASFNLIKEKWYNEHRESYQYTIPGIDGLTLEQFERDLSANLEACRKFLLDPDAEFYPQILTRVPKREAGKFREIYLMTMRDKVVQKAIAVALENRLDRHFYPNLYAFRRGKYYGSMQAGRKVRDFLKANPNRTWVWKTDISDYFDSIRPDTLLKKFAEYLPDEPELMALLKKFVNHRRSDRGIFHSPTLGLPTGSPLSPICANLYLIELDRQMFRSGANYLRYIDDILVVSTDLDHIHKVRQQVESKLGEYRLKVSAKKTFLYQPGESFDYLGYRFADLKVHVGESSMKTFRQWIQEILPRERYRDLPHGNPEERRASLKKILIDFNTGKLIENASNALNQHQIPWIRSFPIVDSDDSFKEMDRYVKERIRMVIMGVASKKNRELLPEAWFRELGYKSLTNAYYRITRRRSLAPYYGWRRYFGNNFLEAYDPKKKQRGIARKWRVFKEKVSFVRKAIRGEI